MWKLKTVTGELEGETIRIYLPIKWWKSCQCMSSVQTGVQTMTSKPVGSNGWVWEWEEEGDWIRGAKWMNEWVGDFSRQLAPTLGVVAWIWRTGGEVQRGKGGGEMGVRGSLWSELWRGDQSRGAVVSPLDTFFRRLAEEVGVGEEVRRWGGAQQQQEEVHKECGYSRGNTDIRHPIPSEAFSRRLVTLFTLMGSHGYHHCCTGQVYGEVQGQSKRTTFPPTKWLLEQNQNSGCLIDWHYCYGSVHSGDSLWLQCSSVSRPIFIN